MSNAREHAFHINCEFQKTLNRLDLIQESYFSTIDIAVTDQLRAQILSKEIVRWDGRLKALISIGLKKKVRDIQPEIIELLKIGVYELLMDDKVPDYAAIHNTVDLARKLIGKSSTSLVNAVLRKLQGFDINKKPSNIDDHDWWSYPRWLFDKWKSQFGNNAAEELCYYNNQPQKLTIRRNPVRCSHEQIIKELNESDVPIIKSSSSDIFYRILSNGRAVLRHSLFKNGSISFQDRAAGAVVEMLDPQPGETVLDVCSAPGTKTVYISERMGDSGEIIASDIDEKRLEHAINDTVRHQRNNIDWKVNDASCDIFPIADRILIDAPCSGTGVINNKPDIKWRRALNNIREFAELQLKIMNNMKDYLTKDGIMVYSTCSMESEENWEVVDAFLNLNPQFNIVTSHTLDIMQWIDTRCALATYPPKDNVSGMFAVKLVKNG